MFHRQDTPRSRNTRHSKTGQHIGAGINNIKKEGGIYQYSGSIQRTSREHAKATGDGKK